MLDPFVALPEHFKNKLFTHHSIENHLVSIHIDSIAPETKNNNSLKM